MNKWYDISVGKINTRRYEVDTLKRTPLSEEYGRYGARMVDFAGWYMPIEFKGILQEHQAVRTGAGIFDVSHMGEITVKGNDALAFTDYLITNDARKLSDNQVLYTFLCREDGGIVDDILVYRFAADDFLLVVNAANIEKDHQWILSNCSGFDVKIENISDKVSQLAVQGPKAQEILQPIAGKDLNSIKFFHADHKVLVDGIECMVSRTGYTGEDGFEIYLDNADAPRLYHKIISLGIEPIGLGARDTLRFEANLPLYGNELSDTVSPIEAGYGFFVKTDKESFIGKEALARQKSEGVSRKTVGFEMVEKKIPRHGYPVTADGKTIGTVTTGYKSPTLDKFIGLALVDAAYSRLGTEIYIEVRGKAAKAVVTSRKFLENK